MSFIVKSHSFQIADTGDYGGYHEITNGKISLFTKDDPDDISELEQIAEALDKSELVFYLDDSAEVQAHMYKLQFEHAIERIEKLKKFLYEEMKNSENNMCDEVTFEEVWKGFIKEHDL